MSNNNRIHHTQQVMSRRANVRIIRTTDVFRNMCSLFIYLFNFRYFADVINYTRLSPSLSLSRSDDYNLLLFLARLYCSRETTSKHFLVKMKYNTHTHTHLYIYLLPDPFRCLHRPCALMLRIANRPASKFKIENARIDVYEIEHTGK